VGDDLTNPVTGEYAKILELPWENPDGRGRAELLAVVGARVLGEHLHPGLIERFTVLEGELTVRLDGTTRLLHEGENAEIRPGQWHDWWNAADRDARVLVEVLPGERFLYLIETIFGLAQGGHVNEKGMPDLLQTVMLGRAFSDTVQFRSPPPTVQKALSLVLACSRAVGPRPRVPWYLSAALPEHCAERRRACPDPPFADGRGATESVVRSAGASRWRSHDR
jgi:mannose-6-phosphate isomerase-like protein (cupin superfamily)